MPSGGGSDPLRPFLRRDARDIQGSETDEALNNFGEEQIRKLHN